MIHLHVNPGDLTLSWKAQASAILPWLKTVGHVDHQDGLSLGPEGMRHQINSRIARLCTDGTAAVFKQRAALWTDSIGVKQSQLDDYG